MQQPGCFAQDVRHTWTWHSCGAMALISSRNLLLPELMILAVPANLFPFGIGAVVSLTLKRLCILVLSSCAGKALFLVRDLI